MASPTIKSRSLSRIVPQSFFSRRISAGSLSCTSSTKRYLQRAETVLRISGCFSDKSSSVFTMRSSKSRTPARCFLRIMLFLHADAVSKRSSRISRVKVKSSLSFPGRYERAAKILMNSAALFVSSSGIGNSFFPPTSFPLNPAQSSRIFSGVSAVRRDFAVPRTSPAPF